MLEPRPVASPRRWRGWRLGVLLILCGLGFWVAALLAKSLVEAFHLFQEGEMRLVVVNDTSFEAWVVSLAFAGRTVLPADPDGRSRRPVARPGVHPPSALIVGAPEGKQVTEIVYRLADGPGVVFRFVAAIAARRTCTVVLTLTDSGASATPCEGSEPTSS